MLLRFEVFLSKTIKSEVLVFLLMELYRILWTERNWKNENFYYALWPSDVALNINSALFTDRSPSFDSSKNPQKQFPLRSLYSIRWSQILYRELSEIAHLVGRIKAVEISYTLRIEIFRNNNDESWAALKFHWWRISELCSAKYPENLCTEKHFLSLMLCSAVLALNTTSNKIRKNLISINISNRTWDEDSN